MRRSEIPPGTLELLILKTLERERELHGFEIARSIGQLSNDVLNVEEGSLYPALQRLLIKGWIAAEWDTTEENRRARYYRLTSSGKKQLAAELKHFHHVFGAVLRVLEVS
jgi:transcriptional regulator